MGPLPRVRCAGQRCSAAVDMFGRGTADTLISFSSGNAYHFQRHFSPVTLAPTPGQSMRRKRRPRGVRRCLAVGLVGESGGKIIRRAGRRAVTRWWRSTHNVF